MDALKELASWIQQRNRVDLEIARVIGRPAEKGHIGEFIASHVFDIALEESATALGFDGRFRSGSFVGKSVNVKLYGKREGLLDINPNGIPDTYLVLTGPMSAAMTSRLGTRPLVIEEVYLFDAPPLIQSILERGRKLGVATSVSARHWQAAQVYPVAARSDLVLTEDQREMLSWFGSLVPLSAMERPRTPGPATCSEPQV